MSSDPTTPGTTTGTAPAYPDHPNWAGPTRFALGAAAVGLGAFAVLGFVNLGQATNRDAGVRQFFLSYLSAWVFWSALPIGGMALLMIHYLAKTSWGILLKKPLEAATRTLPFMALLFIPVAASTFMGESSPYWWSAVGHNTGEHKASDDSAKKERGKGGEHNDADHDKGDRHTVGTQAYKVKVAEEGIRRAVEHERHERERGTFSFLSPPVFVGCSVAYFLIWGALIYFLNKWARDADTDTTKVESSLEKLKNISGPGLIIFAITITMAASQWVMSVEPGWASTMFPVILSVEMFLTALTFSVALFLTLADRPPLKNVLRKKFQIDMGSLMLALTLFWTYTSFSQFMLIWIGNLPEEIPYYLKRSAGGWWYVSAGLIVFHFALPFILLLMRDIKEHPKRLRVMAIYLTVMCAVDMVWWISPAVSHEGEYLFIPMDVAAVVGVGGVWGVLFLWQLKRRPLLPANELYWLPEGHHDEHH